MVAAATARCRFAWSAVAAAAPSAFDSYGKRANGRKKKGGCSHLFRNRIQMEYRRSMSERRVAAATALQGSTRLRFIFPEKG